MSWYKKGLHFKCRQCAKCCSGFPGYVRIAKKEIGRIHKFLKMSKEDFLKKYTRRIFSDLISLNESPVNYDCCFLKNKKCAIYEVRPNQCKAFPFWESNLKDQKSWQALKKLCPGIDNEDSDFFSFEDIQKKLIL